MNTFIRIFLIIALTILSLGSVLGNETETQTATETETQAGLGSGAGSATVTVTTAVPGVQCGPQDQKTGQVECLVPTGFAGVQGIFAAMIKYFTYIAILGSVLFIIINGIMYSMAGLNDGLKATAKDRITKTLIGLVLLLLSGFILNTLAPWVYR